MTVVALSDVKDYLTIKSDTYDTKLTSFIKAAEAALAVDVGFLSIQPEATIRLRGNNSEVLLLPTAPVQSLVSVTLPDGTELDLSDLTLDTFGGFITNNDGSRFWWSYYDVVYIAGRDTVPDDLLLAVKEHVRGMWNLSQRGPGNRNSSPSPDTSSDLLVQKLIEPYRLVRIGAA